MSDASLPILDSAELARLAPGRAANTLHRGGYYQEERIREVDPALPAAILSAGAR